MPARMTRAPKAACARNSEAPACEGDMSIENRGQEATRGQLNCPAGTHKSSF